MARERVVLIDGSSMVYRAFFAIPGNFQTSRGLPTNATYGFALMFRKILAGRRPTMGAVIFDPPGPTARELAYPAYKAQRPAMPPELRQQLPWIDRVVAAHDFPSLRVEGLEADDVIGTLTRQARERGHEVHIISGDKDFAQLVDDGVRMIDTMRDVTFDAEVVRKKWGVPPAQFVDLLALVGDKVDNVPGVPGIGAKGAAELLEKYGSLDEVLAHIDELKGRTRKALEEHRDRALLSRALVTIDQRCTLPVSVEGLAIPEPDLARVDDLYRELEFYSLLRGEEGARDASPRRSAEDAHASAGTDGPRASASYESGVVTSLDELDDCIAELGEEPASFVTLWEEPSFVTGELVGLAFASASGRAHFVPLYGGEGALGDAALARLRTWLEDAGRPKITHDLRDQWTVWARRAVELSGVVFDTQLASFLIDPTKLIPHRLDQLVREYLHRAMPAEKALLGSGKSQRALRDVPLAELGPHACGLAKTVAELHAPLAARLAEEGQEANLRDESLPLARVLGRMQLDGIRVDPDDLGRVQVELESKKAAVEAQIYELAGHELNLGSTKQLAALLFDELKLPVVKRTKTGYSTDAEVLERLASEHEICALIVRQRALSKLIHTYTEVLRAAVCPATGRVHCTLQQTSGASGRLITTDPDLQRTPTRTDEGKRIREAFLPREGWVLISADWSQIELRVLAHFSHDPQLLEAFRRGVDVHRQTASQLFDVPPADVTAAQRNVGKTVNFATIYGQGATALAQQLGIPRVEAKAYIERYFERHEKVRTWLDATIAEAHRAGFVTTLLGRRRYIPELRSNNFNDRAYGERIAANTPIQGSAADLCKLAMLRIAEQLEARGMRTKMLLQIHDELLFEAPPDELGAAEALIRAQMELPYPLAVPLVVDLGHGASWAAAK
jgi:DNA polymerase-1